jgi:hypothetical protein
MARKPGGPHRLVLSPKFRHFSYVAWLGLLACARQPAPRKVGHECAVHAAQDHLEDASPSMSVLTRSADAAAFEQDGGRLSCGDQPAVVEGTLVSHCAYGIPGFGENPKVDWQARLAVLVLDEAVQLWATEPNDKRCFEDVRMVQTNRFGESLGRAPDVRTLIGNRVRVVVDGFFQGHTGHHYTRFLLGVADIQVLGPATGYSLKEHWAEVEADFVGVSCEGWPR